MRRYVDPAQPRAHNPLQPVRGRRLDRPGPELRQQRVTDQLVTAFLLRVAASQPPREVVGVRDAALPEPEVRPDLRTVPDDRAPGPLVEPDRSGTHAKLPRDELDRVVMQLAAAALEPAEPAIKLQQQRETKLRVVVLRGHQVALSPDQRPVLDQVTKLQRRTFHKRPSS